MPESTDNDESKQRWHGLWQQGSRWYVRWIPVGGLVMLLLGAILWGAFNTVLEATNTEAFCVSCHEMRDFVYAEYQQTIHFKNRTGVRATCPDCHVPHPYMYKLARKVKASNELLHKMLGTIDTPEKFEAHRAELAGHVWETMKSTDSRECRNCHSLLYMDLAKQDKSARRKHSLEYAQETGKTCIDCHKGIAHHLPKVNLSDDKPAEGAPKGD